ncbi:MAG: hypothetical protein ACLPSM_04375 [Acidimicrobiales bacterium]
MRQTAELSGKDSTRGDDFGPDVAISGTTTIVGGYGHAHGAGRAYVFVKAATGWNQVAELEGSNTVAGDNFGGARVQLG